MWDAMEKFRLSFQDHVFFERHGELSDQQIRHYLRGREAIRMSSDPEVMREVKQERREGKGKIGIEDGDVDFTMNLELLCEKGFIIRERIE